ncbi:MAG: hypothetical protein QW502_02020 [Candidatus Bathyarchaeia archaeon]|nr:hypothetical protein [Candidatus Bathyarchaeota archaeon]
MLRRRRKGQTSLEILALLLIALAITAVSAAVYNLLYMNLPISVEPAKIRFVSGDDSTVAGAQIGVNGTYVSFNSVSGWPNALRVYTDAVRIKNFDPSSRTINLRLDSYNGDTSAVEFIRIKLFDGDTQMGNTIEAGTGNTSTGDLSMSAGAEWRVQLEIRWKDGVLSTYSVSLQLSLVVPGE